MSQGQDEQEAARIAAIQDAREQKRRQRHEQETRHVPDTTDAEWEETKRLAREAIRKTGGRA